MPISRAEFDSSLDSVAFAVINFLRGNMDDAYTADEIADAVGPFERSAVVDAIARLLAGDWIESSTRAGEVYYSYRRWLGLRRR